jgi:hypothetical protein
MKALIFAVLVAMTVGFFGATESQAAPASGAPLAQAAGETSGVQQVWYDRFGRWHPNRPVYRAPMLRRGPACRTVRVCGPYRCTWQRRCY